MNRQPESSRGILLPGLEGTNPLGFLAALGVLQVLNRDSDQSQMKWTAAQGTWIPELIGANLDPKSLIDRLTDLLARRIEDHPVHLLDQLGDSNERGNLQRRALFELLSQSATLVSRDQVDWLAALASDAVPPSESNQLQTIRSDYQFGNLTSIISGTRRQHLERALLSPWDYRDPLSNQSLHVDPSEDRRHAYQWNAPSLDPDRKRSGGMLGANRLALEAFRLFTSSPKGELLQTLGFSGHRRHNTRWTWPIWDVPLKLSLVHSVLAQEDLQSESISPEVRDRLRRRGVVAVIRTWRILVGKTPNFTPGARIA